MTTQDRPFSPTNPPPIDDVEASIEWAEEIIKSNREFVEKERRNADETRSDPYPYL